MTIRACKLRLYPNTTQRLALAQWFGASRWVWNWRLEYRSKAYRRRGESVSGVDFSRLLTRLKKTPSHDWLKATPATVYIQKLRDQDRAFRNFFEGRTRYPRFKKRAHAQAIRLQLDQRQARLIGRWKQGEVVIPGLGAINYRGAHPHKAPKMVTLRQLACGHYVATFTVEADIRPLPASERVIAIDLGIKDLATLSDGCKFDNPRHLPTSLRRLRRAQRALQRKKKGSSGYKRKRREVARLHQRVKDARLDALHKLTSILISENQAICIEDLNVKGMVKNRRLARAISDLGLGELRRQLEYKAAWRGRTVICVDRYFPSSKTCSSCGHVLDELNLATRHWMCPKCHTHHDRDINAAVNIEREGLKALVPEGDRGIHARGEPSAGRSRSDGETQLNDARIVTNRDEAMSGTPDHH